MQSTGRYLIGIDLGTSNAAVAYIDTQDAARNHSVIIHIFEVPQLIAEGEVAAASTLPSFLYFAGAPDTAGNSRLPWQEQAAPVVGVLARGQGARGRGPHAASATWWL